MGIALGSTKINNVSIGLEEVQTVKNAVTDIKSALTEKGVTVPDGTRIDGLAALIGGIEVGGNVEPFVKVLTGTHTPATNETSITFLPSEASTLWYFILRTLDGNSITGNYISKFILFRDYPQGSRVFYNNNSHWSLQNYSSNYSNEEALTFPGNSSTTLYLKAGITYEWIAVYE